MTGILQNTIRWFQLAKPEPTSKDFHTQLGVHFEEVAELIDTITAITGATQALRNEASRALSALANHLKASDDVIRIDEVDRVDFLDALCDGIVTAAGSAHIAGADIISGMTEVNRSNFSKFGEDGQPILHPETRKIMKGPGYSPPDLSIFV